MAKKTDKSIAQRKARQAMKKRSKEKQRHKAKAGVAVSENAVQHKMLSEFGNAQNFVRNILHLSDLFKTDEDLRALRFDVDKVYAHFDLAADREALADAYAKVDDLPAYDEKFEEFWRSKRKAILEELVDKDFAVSCDKVFKKLIITKKGFKKDYRAAMAGSLLVQSHLVALSPSEAPVEDNNLWELILLATIKENQKELPVAPIASESEAVAQPVSTEAKPEE